jgi:hypothetical protein
MLEFSQTIFIKTLIESGGGTGPMKPGNLSVLVNEKVLIPARLLIPGP